MEPAAAVAILLVVAVGGGLAVLTGVGGRRRGYGAARCVGSAIVFPATWVVWYFHDKR